MTVYELNKDELIELKQRYYIQNNTVCSYNDLSSVDTLVKDKEIFEEYNNVTFTKDDFWCNSNDESKKEEKIFENNLKYYKGILEDTKDYIDSYSEGDLTLKEVGEKYSKKLANIMFDLLYAGWSFKDLNSLENMKTQMAETIRDDYEFQEIRSNRKKEEIIKEIYDVNENECESKKEEEYEI